ncbi:MAG: DNA polymerase [Candidatus Thorarchaeota archaeon]|jgi:DNA polymerase-1
MAIDVETEFNPDGIRFPWHPGAYLSTVAIVTSDGEKKVWTFTHIEAPYNPTDEKKIAQIQAYIDKSECVIAHNMQFEYHWLTWLGVKLEKAKLYDTMIGEYLIGAHKEKMCSLDHLALEYLGERKLDKVREFWYNGVSTKEIPLATLQEYNIKDSDLTLRIARKQWPKIRKLGLRVPLTLTMKQVPMLCDMQKHGLKLDGDVIDELRTEFEGRVARVEEELREIAGRPLNLESKPQLSSFLYGGHYTVGAREWYVAQYKSGRTRLKSRRTGVKVRKEYTNPIGFTPIQGSELANGGWSTSVATLQQLKCKTKQQRNVKALLLRRSADAQTLKAFIKRFQREAVGGIIHVGLNQTSTSTGRYSSSFHNTPRDGTAPIKRALFPQLGYFVECDASQLEWKAAAFLSQDPVMCQEIRDGIDNHAATGHDHFGGTGIRTDWKVFNFRMIYGGTPYSFYMDYKMPSFSQKKWQHIWESFYEKYAGLREWQLERVDEVYSNGGYLRGITGRIFKFNLYDRRGVQEYKPTEIVNYPVQSFATADIIPVGMLSLRHRLRHLGRGGLMCLQVHDSIVVDTKEEHVEQVAAICKNTMDDLPMLIKKYFGIHFNLPLGGDVKYGRNLGEMTEWP